MGKKPDSEGPGNAGDQQGVNAGVENEIVFSIGSDLFPLLMDRTKRWYAAKWDITDDRMYRLSQGHAWHGSVSTHVDRWVPEVDHVVFRNEDTGEYLSLEFMGIEFAPWAVGWAFLILGEVVDGGVEELPW